MRAFQIWLVALAWACGQATPPEEFWPLLDFELVDQEGKAFGSGQLQGQVWVAGFLFTRCRSTCPLQTAQLGRLQQRLREEGKQVLLVSISVDPEYDNPTVLKEYATEAGADPGRWRFLTGAREAIWKLSKEGFKLGVGEDPGSADMPIFHSTRVVLVDGQGRVRGYYDGVSEEGMEALWRDLEQVMRR